MERVYIFFIVRLFSAVNICGSVCNFESFDSKKNGLTCNLEWRKYLIVLSSSNSCSMRYDKNDGSRLVVELL
jgi:hypothetical protein